MENQAQANIEQLNHGLRNNALIIEGCLKQMVNCNETFIASLENDLARNSPQFIMLHHSLTKDSGTASWSAIREWHTGQHPDSPHKWIDIGYHFGIELINNSYEILMGRPMLTPGAHTKGMNRNSIGICFVGNFDKHPVPAGQWEKGLVLARSLMEVFNIPAENIRGHREYANKTCPGKLFDLDKFRKEICNV